MTMKTLTLCVTYHAKPGMRDAFIREVLPAEYWMKSAGKMAAFPTNIFSMQKMTTRSFYSKNGSRKIIRKHI